MPIFEQPIQLIVPSRLEIVSTTSVKIAMVVGRHVQNPLNGEVIDVSSEPTDDTTGLSADTLYQVYLDTGTGAVTIEATASTTTYGIPHATGDTGKLLVGWVFTNGSTQFVDSVISRHVVSRYHARPKAMLASGAFQSNLVADATWKTPTTDMLLSWIRHTEYDADLSCSVSLRHDSGTGYCGVGIDVALTGTPTVISFQEFTDASDVSTISLLTSDPYGTALRRQARVRVQAEAVGANTFDIYSGSSRISGRIWG